MPTRRILACLSDQTTAQAVIRSAARLATARQAELYAVHVQPLGTNTRRSPQSAEQLNLTLQLARNLGAQVHVLHSHRVADSIVQFARAHGIDTIVLGKSDKTGWRRWLSTDLASRILKQRSDMEVILVES